ncbi:MAG: STAS domain-containing protein [Akkermansiaceae bacterium]|nr:STAS domain-containing protein [Armatimonadota bacterium]
MQDEQDVLLLHTGEESGDSLVRAVGDIDLSTTPQLRQAVEETIARLPTDGELRYMVLDIREVPFIDSAGLALLVEIRKRFHNTCRLAVLIAASTQPERVLRLGRFDTFLIIGYSLEELHSSGVGAKLVAA